MMRFAGLLIAGLLVSACESAPPEQRLQATADQLQDTTTDLDEVTREIERLELELEKRRKQRRTLAARQLTLEERLAARATDVALFRAVQKTLLEHDELQNTAVQVSVDDRRVSLRGIVYTAEQRDAAIEATRSTPGIADVRSLLDIQKEEQEQ